MGYLYCYLLLITSNWVSELIINIFHVIIFYVRSPRTFLLYFIRETDAFKCNLIWLTTFRNRLQSYFFHYIYCPILDRIKYMFQLSYRRISKRNKYNAIKCESEFREDRENIVNWITEMAKFHQKWKLVDPIFNSVIV